MNRVGAALIALDQAKNADIIDGIVLASDAFFPFDDVVRLAHQYGVTAIIQPGGSVRDEESIISAITNEDPHEFYKRVIAPYKGELEMWYQEHKSLFLDLQLIFMTAWVILDPSSTLYVKWFKNLPKRNFK